MADARQVVVVTGASAGLGRAVVRRFAADGAHVALLARDRTRLEAAAREVEAGGGRALVLPTDVADADAVDAAAAAAERELGPIDVWVNNAMVSVYAPVAAMTAAEYRRVTEVTYLGCVYGTLAALRHMRPRDRGVIVQVGSALAYRSIPLQSAYCAAKHAIVGFTASLRTELIHDDSGVRVVMVHMPALNTPQFEWTRNRLPHRPQPVPPIFQPEVGAEAVHYAALHDVGRELMVALPTLKAVVGNKFIPGLLDHYLADAAWSGEQTDEPAIADRPDNLFDTVPGDWAAHGRFDDRSEASSTELSLRLHRNLLAVAGAGLVGLALGLFTNGGRRAAGDVSEPPDSALAEMHVPS